MEYTSFYTTNDPFFLRNKESDKGVLLIHGFGSSAAEMRGIGDYLYKKGFSVNAVLLKGHGKSKEDLAKTDFKDWLDSAQKSYERLSRICKDIYIVGTSMGSLISIQIALRNNVSGIILVSPPLFKPSWKWYLIPFAKNLKLWYVIGKGIERVNYSFPYTVVSYDKVPTKNLEDFIKLLNMARKYASDIKVPSLILQGVKDQIIPQESGEELLSILGSKNKKVIYYDESAHSLLVDKERQKVWEDILGFINTLQDGVEKF